MLPPMVKFAYATGIAVATLVGAAAATARAPHLPRQTPASSYWYANIDHTSGPVRGYAPDLDGDDEYVIQKIVSPGGGGAAIQAAIREGTGGAMRHGMWFASQPRVVYLQPGEYLVNSTIHMNTDTILIGDATSPPILKAAAGFSGDTLLSGMDPSVIADGVWRGELSFAIGLKNLILDTTNILGGSSFTALYWGVAQASQTQNLTIRLPPSIGGNGHTGIRLGRGSTLGLADIRIERGQNGIVHAGHQQALFKSIYFYQNSVGMLIDGGSTISLLNPTFDTCGFGVRHIGGFPWIAIVDGTSINSGVTFQTTTWPSFLIENLNKDTLSNIVEGPGTFVLSGQSHVSRFSYGNTVDASPIYGPITTSHTRALAAAPGGRIPVFPAPNYASHPVTDFINIKDPSQNGGHHVWGDNTRDESAALNAILAYAAANNKIAYFPFGKYRVDSTLFVPPGSRIVGEAWATVTGSGIFFSDPSNPQPVVKVGNPGQTGVAHIQDMRFTVSDVLPGAIIVQFHLKGTNPGDVAMWNSLITVGGVRGAPGVTGSCWDASAQCRAAFLGLHLAATSSVYIENVWNWVADHIVEDFSGGSRIAGGRGALVEATQGTWLHALGSEHWWLYQLNMRNATNVVVSMLQSETNYDQGDNNPQLPPAPWTPDVGGWGDPDFSWCNPSAEDNKRCRMGPATIFNGGSDIYSYASASWAFFSGPNYTPCSGSFQCQKYMHWVQTTPASLNAFGLCSKDTYATLRLADGVEIVTSPDYTGSWPGGGGDVGRYTT